MLRMSFSNRKQFAEYSFRPFVYEEVKPDKQRGRVPLPRSGHRVVADNSSLYSFGGYNPLALDASDEEDGFSENTYPLFQELWKFNFASRKWTSFSRQDTLPQELASNAVVRHGNFLMVYACVRSVGVSLKPICSCPVIVAVIRANICVLREVAIAEECL